MSENEPDAREWISWAAASQRTGLPVPTIEHAVRVNRIDRRPMRGSLPTLDAASVDRWAAWYRDLQQRKRNSPPRRARSWSTPLPPGDWLTTREAAEQLGVTTSTIRRHAKLGLLQAHHGDQLWVSQSSVRRLLDDEATWIFMDEAGALLGCSSDVIPKLVAAGHLERREVARVTPSISRASVEAYAPVLGEQQKRDAQRRHDAQLQRRAAVSPPADGQVWLNVPTTALLLKMSASGVLNRIHADLLPATKTGRRWWVRRVDAEQAAAARVFAHRMDALQPTSR